LIWLVIASPIAAAALVADRRAVYGDQDVNGHAEICPTETNRDRLATALRRRCRSEKVEPPSTGQVESVVASGCRQFDDAFAATTAARIGPATCGRLEDLLSRPNVLADLKSDVAA
jgi:hypothetical protein